MSFELWHLLTSSFGMDPPLAGAGRRADASDATTSFMFVFVDVPEPVW